MVNITTGDGAEQRLRDLAAFEAPWLKAGLAASFIMALAMVAPSSALGGALSSLMNLFASCIAVGLTPRRKLFKPLLVASLVAMLAGALLPSLLLAAMWLFIGVLLLSLVALLRYQTPYGPVRIRPRQTYRFAGQTYTLPELTYRSSRLFIVREDIQRQLMETAIYAEQFLARHGIRYVICYGTLLGALRHGGPMPWDDDIDFTIYHPDDLARMDSGFDSLAAEAARDGYHLFRYSDYWKIAPKGFWRFPVVDLYRAALGHPLDRAPARLPFGGLHLCAPENPEEIMKAYYGPDCLTTVVFDIPFWDSGFVPAALGRLLPERASDALSALYERLFR